jgi:cytochrome b
MHSSQTPTSSPRGILVWDLPTRVFHWLLALSFAGAYVTAESEHWRLVHVTLGYTVGGLIAFRLLWGLAGTRHARFASFVRGPAAVLRYLRSLFSGQPEHHVGHNPAGALAIVALLALGATLVLTGWSTYNEIGGEWLEELHEGVANTMLAVVLVHIAAVLLSSRLHHENLARAMLTGRKQGAPAEGIRRSWRVLGVLLLAAVLAFWVQQWRSAPAPVPAAGAQYSGDHDD